MDIYKKQNRYDLIRKDFIINLFWLYIYIYILFNENKYIHHIKTSFMNTQGEITTLLNSSNIYFYVDN